MYYIKMKVTYLDSLFVWPRDDVLVLTLIIGYSPGNGQR